MKPSLLESVAMTKADIKCYRTNYDKACWKKYANGEFCTMPLGILDAIAALCDEVERLNGWKKKRLRAELEAR